MGLGGIEMTAEESHWNPGENYSRMRSGASADV